jgi:hypothetical protein
VIFYVYELRFPEGKPFYVGKGADDGSREFKRAHMHWRKNQLVAELIRAMRARGERPIVEIVFESEVEDEAFSEERRLVELYGRRFDGGLLWNVAPGGRGGVYAGRPMPPEVRAKISASKSGRRHTPDACERMRQSHTGVALVMTPARRAVYDARRGVPRSDEVKRKTSETQKGKPRPKHSEETRAKMVESAKAGWIKRKAAANVDAR